MGFSLDDNNVEVTVPNRKVKPSQSFGANNFRELDARIPDVEFKTPKSAVDLKLGLPGGRNGPIRKGAKIIRQSQKNGRRSRNKTFGIKSTAIKDGAEFIRRNRRR